MELLQNTKIFVGDIQIGLSGLQIMYVFSVKNFLLLSR